MKLQLEKNDRICFLGDSITQNGLWIKEICEYFIRNYPELEIGIYNCGIGGTRGYEADIKNRLYCDCFNLFPKYVAVMFGMNDTFEFLGGNDCSAEEKNRNLEYIKERFEQSLENIINQCEKANTVPIILAPTPYDEYNEYPEQYENRYADISLKNCRDVAERVAKKHNLIFLDMRELIFCNMEKKPISDRIHPNEYGQHLMAESFLYGIGAKDSLEPDKPCVFSEKNNKRYEIEHILRYLMFVERDCMLWQHRESIPLDERKEELKERIKREDSKWLKDYYDNYFENIEYLDEIRGELVRRTVDIYR